MGIKDARHLLVRTGLGLRWHDLEQYSNKSRKESVHHIVHNASNQGASHAPKLTNWIPWTANQNAEQKRTLGQRLTQDKQALKQWQVQTLLRTSQPLTERMVLFWHNHFTTSIDKVNQVNLSLNQNLLFRHHALGNFKKFLHQVSRDPAMLIYLDNNSSKIGKPNENFARELLELFTLGEGHYSEADVQAAAKAFTGWSGNRRTGKFVFQQHLHDGSVKRFMGKVGRFNGDHIIDILLENPHTSEHITRQFWAEFVGDDKPNEATIRRWGTVFRRADYDIRTLLTEVLNSPEFWSSKYRGEKIKSPVELIVGTLRTLTLPPPSTYRIVNLCSALGQPLLTPETPRGYLGGEEWINTHSLPTRVNLMSNFISAANQQDIARIPNLPSDKRVGWLLAQKPVNAVTNASSHRNALYALLV